MDKLTKDQQSVVDFYDQCKIACDDLVSSLVKAKRQYKVAEENLKVVQGECNHPVWETEHDLCQNDVVEVRTCLQCKLEHLIYVGASTSNYWGE